MSHKVPDILVTFDKVNYNWKYIQNDDLYKIYKNFISRTPRWFKKDMVKQLIKEHPTIL